MPQPPKTKGKPFYITTPIFYPNANLHMGHAFVMTIADIKARYHRFTGDETFFLTGSDENTGKVIEVAKTNKEDVSVYLDSVTEGFKSLYKDLDISYDQFIRTSDKKVHWPGAIRMWEKLVQAGDIYKSHYQGLYCEACEAFYTEKDLVNGLCPYHETKPKLLKEENYFFRLSKYTKEIEKKILNNELKIIPETRRNEILALLSRGLEDISFSRPMENVPHGIPVPGDSSQVIYVWCDALVNYISALGFGSDDDSKFKKFWPADFHVIGKDILRFHAAIWPGMLFSAGLPLPKAILVHGMITSGGKKMSKSLGNVIDPREILREFGTDALRYYLAREVSPFEDGDITKGSFKLAYNANLANGLGNLASRIMKMASTHLSGKLPIPEKSMEKDFMKAFDIFDIQKATNIVWEHIGELDKKIQETEPFKLVKTDKEKATKIIEELVIELYNIGRMLNPVLPETSAVIMTAVKENKMFDKPLFPRKD